jgi:hypothetical protein
MKVLAHKHRSSTQIGLAGKSYKLDANGILDPQPFGDDRKQVLLLRAIHIIDVQGPEDVAKKDEELTPPKPKPSEPAPPAPAKTAGPSAEALGVVANLASAMARVAGGDAPVPPSKTLEGAADAPPADHDALTYDEPVVAPVGFNWDSLSKADLYEIVKERGVPGASQMSKSDLLAIVKAG